MVEIALGESVKSVRSKLGIESTDYHTAWGTLNIGAALAWEPSLTLQQRKAQEIYLKRFGNIPLKEAGILGGIDELKDYYRLHVDPLKDGKTGSKILETLEVKGAAAWVIHNAVKRNHDKHRKETQVPNARPKQRAESSKTGASAEGSDAPRVMWDPARNV